MQNGSQAGVVYGCLILDAMIAGGTCILVLVNVFGPRMTLREGKPSS